MGTLAIVLLADCQQVPLHRSAASEIGCHPAPVRRPLSFASGKLMMGLTGDQNRKMMPTRIPAVQGCQMDLRLFTYLSASERRNAEARGITLITASINISPVQPSKQTEGATAVEGSSGPSFTGCGKMPKAFPGRLGPWIARALRLKLESDHRSVSAEQEEPLFRRWPAPSDRPGNH
jgi:hypothetical protein